MRSASALIGLAFLAFAGSAQAANVSSLGACATFQVLGTDLDLTYNPFRPAPVAHPFLMRITRLNPAATGVRFILVDATPSRGRSRIGTAGPFDYNIVWLNDEAQQVFYFGSQSVNSANSASVSFDSSGRPLTLNFALQIPPGQPVPASQQFENVEVIYQCEFGNKAGMQQVQDDSRVQIRLAIPRYFGAYIGSPGRTRGQIDFGSLTDDTSSAQKFVSVTAVSTVDYTIRVSTDRGSTLRRSDRDPEGIPYTMQFANTQVRDNSVLACPRTQTALGDTEPFTVKLAGEHLHDLHAGSYRDTITLTFTPSDLVRPGPDCQLLP
jgi:hypothetical protein